MRVVKEAPVDCLTARTMASCFLPLSLVRFFCGPYGSISPLGNKISRSIEPKTVGSRKHRFPGGSLGVMVCVAAPMASALLGYPSQQLLDGALTISQGQGSREECSCGLFSAYLSSAGGGLTGFEKRICVGTNRVGYTD